jgi:type I restriction enzyme S subunit
MPGSPLPSSWEECRLGDVVDYGATQKAEPDEIPADAWVLELEDIEKDTSKVLQRVTFAQRRSKSTKNRFAVGDVLYGKLRPYLNKVIRADQGGYCTTEIVPLKPSEAIDGGYLFYWLKHPEFLEYVTSVSHGLNMPRLGTEAGKEAPFVLAPLNEQKRIADKLDAVLARVDSCRERLARVPAILKCFRQAVLAAATSGKLTEEWRATVSGHDLADWKPVTLESLLDGKPRNGYSPRAVEYETPVKSLTLTATTTGRFRPEHFKYIDEDIPPSSHLWLLPSDILIQRANTIEYVGISAIYDGPPNGFIYPDLMMKCRANARVIPTFLHYLLLSEPVRRHFRENATGTAGNMPKINQQTVLSAPALIPPHNEQSEIVHRVEALFAYADRLEARYTAARDQVERMTPALLAKAFRGELVPQDPKDEPAVVLLERIRAARAEQPMAKRGRKPTAARVPRAPREKAAMTKSRQDDDVLHKPYLAGLLREAGGIAGVEDLFRRAELPVTDFYKQLAWEVENGHIRDDETRLEAA